MHIHSEQMMTSKAVGDVPKCISHLDVRLIFSVVACGRTPRLVDDALIDDQIKDEETDAETTG